MSAPRVRRRITVTGLVQGVGFRPFIFTVARGLGVGGFVRNTPEGVVIEAEGPAAAVTAFLRTVRDRPPPTAHVGGITTEAVAIAGDARFAIVASLSDGAPTVTMPRDRAPCAACLAEMADPANRRHRHAFITCHDCGPRFTIARALPFERETTAMAAFPPCAACRREYEDPDDRRFHAQTISCPACGPVLTYRGSAVGALEEARAVIARGGLVAVKGAGGYQLVCGALSVDAVTRLRRFKERTLKPFAVMAPGHDEVARICRMSAWDASWLTSPVAPVLLLRVTDATARASRVHDCVAPGLATLGVLLPATPLHRLLLGEDRAWLVVTSANRRGEPMLTDDGEAQDVLQGVVDGILSHDRDVVHRADDSVIRTAGSRTIVLRHARGLAPTELPVSEGNDAAPRVTGIALGGHAKSAFALATRDKLVLGQHVGDLVTRRAEDAFLAELASFETLYGLPPGGIVAHDAHPDYATTAWAARFPRKARPVRHHEAHLASVITEKSAAGKALGVTWDGSGWGENGELWGGEFFVTRGSDLRRVASLWPFPLLGGDVAVKEPRRSAWGLLHAAQGEAAREDPFVREAFTESERRLLGIALARGIQVTPTSSVGRLFDGCAALAGLTRVADYEAQAAMALEAWADEATSADPHPRLWHQDPQGLWLWDWRPLVPQASAARASDAGRRRFAASFHATLAHVIADLATRCGVGSVAVSGGVFQNAALVRACDAVLARMGLAFITPDVVPVGDGGLALGQIAVARREREPHVSRHTRPSDGR